ncbi:MAG: nitrate ABC transporter permease [Clostridia bacterium]|nr:nitrate ABC transporter permease [Clostridia bacterium]
MPNSTIRKKNRIRIWAVIAWLAIWQAAAMIVGRDFLLASPIQTIACFFRLACTAEFYLSALYSLIRIFSGFLLGMAAGVVSAALSVRFRAVRDLLTPLHAVLRAIPVASFVIAALIWLPAKNLSILISFLIVFPQIYGGMRSEFERRDPKLIEMAALFRMKPLRRAIYIYALPSAKGFESLCAGAIGLAWKSGIAAELIAIPNGSIGEMLYQAKVYLMSGELFAWTILIILLSAACTRIFTLLVRLSTRLIERM